MNFEIIWDGTITGRNRGLLCVDAEVVRPAPPIPRGLPTILTAQGVGSRADTVERVRAACAEPATIDTIAEALGVSLTTVQRAIRELKAQDAVIVAGPGVRRRRLGVAPQRYQAR
jgi:CRP-like cAMP-binding protein